MTFDAAVFDNEVLYHVEDNVAVITLNAPKRMNTMGSVVYRIMQHDC